MRDLVERSWPVTYSTTIYPPALQFTTNNLLLVYYFGYWLPAAAVGKLFGLTAANIALLIWTFFGLVLIYTLACRYLEKYSYVAVLLLIIWSGLDIVGTLYAIVATTKSVELNFLTHLERWANYFNVYAQFSSNTTLLYWVFNQTIPIWLCVLLYINNKNTDHIFLIICLSLFLAPLGTLGFLPFVAIRLIQRLYKGELSAFIEDYLTIPNTIGASAVLLVTGLFFSMNRAGSMKSIVWFDMIPYLAFLLLEVGILGGLLYFYKRDNTILICLAVLAFIPFIKLGRFYDFAMRASIAYLFLLCLLTIKFLLDEETNRTGKFLVMLYLVLGSVTAFLEIGRSVFFTGSHAASKINSIFITGSKEHLLPASLKGTIKDRDFLYDHIRTFSRYNKDIETIIDQYIGESTGSIFADYLLKKPNGDSYQSADKK